jgi:predicted DNA-binding transcriptional regulator AlpA
LGRQAERKLVTQRQAQEYCGGVTAMTLWRWRHRFDDFPKPVRINNRVYFDVNELSAWLESRREVA